MQNLHYLATATLKMKSMDFRFSFFSAALAGKSPRVSAHRTNCTSHVFETPLQSVKTKRALSLGSTTTFTTIRQRRIETREETRHETSVPSSRTEKRTLARAPFLPTRQEMASGCNLSARENLSVSQGAKATQAAIFSGRSQARLGKIGCIL